MQGNTDHAWRILQVSPMHPAFADTITVTRSIDCLKTGHDPYTFTAFDPWHRVYNYPPVWLDLRYLGVTSRSTNFLGVSFALMTLGAFLLLLRARRPASVLVIVLAVCSGPVMFAVERGNTDQVIFALLVFGFFWIARQSARVKGIFTGVLTVLLTVLKIYPVVTAFAMVRNRKGVLWALLTVTAACAALVLASGKGAMHAVRNTPRDLKMSFGAFPFSSVVGHHLPAAVGAFADRHTGKVPTLAAMLGAALAICAASLYRRFLPRFLPPLDFNRARGCIAVSCLAIYCAIFISGASYNYRLLFLIGVLGYLAEDMDLSGSLRSLPLAVAMLLFFNTDAVFPLLHELMDGLIFLVGSAWLGTALLENLGVLPTVPALGGEVAGMADRERMAEGSTP